MIQHLADSSAQFWQCTGRSVSQLVPLGLNNPAPFGTLGGIHVQESYILPPARSVIEDEMRRNTFWLAYAIDKMAGIGFTWTFGLDDKDVSQFLPVRGDKFENGVRYYIRPALLESLTTTSPGSPRS